MTCFTETQKSRYLENKALVFLQIKKLINSTSRATLWQKNSFVAEMTFKLNAPYTLHLSTNSLKWPLIDYVLYFQALPWIDDTVEQGSYLKNEIASTMHTALLYSVPDGLNFGSELWNIYEKFLGHTNESLFYSRFFYSGLLPWVTKKSADARSYGFYHYKSTWQDVATT